MSLLFGESSPSFPSLQKSYVDDPQTWSYFFYCAMMVLAWRTVGSRLGSGIWCLMLVRDEGERRTGYEMAASQRP